METRHIRIDYAQTLSGKKQLLSSEISMIYIARTLLRYKLLRRKELALKNQLKTSTTILKTKLNALLSSFPVAPKTKTMPKQIKKESSKEEKNLSEELKNIQQQLAKLQ